METTQLPLEDIGKAIVEDMRRLEATAITVTYIKGSHTIFSPPKEVKFVPKLVVDNKE